ncbi:hypothetical protein [Fluviicola sp.]|jgi:hypothetical protein|uniref:hypothetical protein n=1 Tax=Fluviicola sp. TaxID=1917219 RepID=UPI0028399309|nr:hypothetical protein [Fluviicola sp.]MDR0801381.1 hypothetical protein [Fluviicola sp.]
MNFTKGLLLGLTSGILSSGVCIAYNEIYSEAFYINFSSVLTITGIVLSSILGCLLMAMGYVIITKLKKTVLIPWLNVLYCILSFVSVISVLGYKLPLDVEFPEMFPGLAVPMHFFPTLSFLALVPFFLKLKTTK